MTINRLVDLSRRALHNQSRLARWRWSGRTSYLEARGSELARRRYDVVASLHYLIDDGAVGTLSAIWFRPFT